MNNAYFLVDGNPADGVPVDDRGLNYGDGLFETIAVREGTCRLVDRHLARMREGCRRLAITEPEEDSLANELQTVAAGIENGTIRLTITRGSGPRGYAPVSGDTRRILAVYPERNRQHPAATFNCMVCVTPVTTNPVLAGLKTLGRLDNVLARSECMHAGVDEGIMLDALGGLVCGTMSNVFLVANGEIMTPTLEHAGVRGVMRDFVLETAGDAGWQIRECRLSEGDLLGAEEIFLTNALLGIRRVTRIDEKVLQPARVTTIMRRLLADAGIAECSD